MLVCPPVVAVVCRLVDLRLLLNGGVLAALSSAALWREESSVSCHVMLCVYSNTVQLHDMNIYTLLSAKDNFKWYLSNKYTPTYCMLTLTPARQSLLSRTSLICCFNLNLKE